ncbi:MAG: hypothetical protein HW389_2789, partial [Bacteroidetes bacterium]|nr:hypothetical protein [Bacteroidota bacterium]
MRGELLFFERRSRSEFETTLTELIAIAA